MSDPFDTADIGGATDDDLLHDQDHGLLEEEENALPTLARFPFAETNNQNCWSEPNYDIFSVRGPNYLKDRKKIPATHYLLQARGSDLFLSDHPDRVNMAK